MTAPSAKQIYTSGAVALVVQGQLVGSPSVALSELGGIDTAGPGTLTFIRSDSYAKRWTKSRAGAALVTRGIDVPGHDPAARALIFVEDADRAIVKLLEVAHQQIPAFVPGAGVHPTCLVDPSAKIDPTAKVGPMCVIGPGAVVGAGTVLHARAFLGMGARVGERSVLHPNVTIYDRCVVGSRTILHAGVVVGADGFGYVPAADGMGVIKVPHIGHVEIGDEVEIGANSCVDRGKFGATTIGFGTKIDNLVQIGHNCEIGRCVIICGMCGVGGGVKIGDGAILAGHVGVADQLSIGSRAKIGAKSGVLDDVPANEAWSGLPARPHMDQMRTWAAVQKLPEVLRALKQGKSAQEAAGVRLRTIGEGGRATGRS